MRDVVWHCAGAIGLVAAGIAVGWLAADHGGHSEGDAGPATTGGAPVLSEQALANLGVTIRPAELSDFVQSVRVQATIEDAPLNTRPLTTSLGGVVTELHVRPGRRVRPGDALVTLARAEIARPELVLTGALLPSLSEDFHEAVSAHRNAATQVAIVRRELDRVRRFTESGTDEGLPVLPRQTQIDLEYDLARAEQALANAVREIERHGVSADEIEELAADAGAIGNDRLWRNALRANGFWSEHEDAALEALPESLRRVPWVVGALGELAAAGRGGHELCEAVSDEPRLRARFVEALSLLLEGHSVERVRLLAANGELEPVVVLRAPQGTEDWDVESVDVRPGQRVDGGATLAVLHDARTMWMRAEPIGEEVASVTRAFEAASPLSATPLLSGAGPELDGLVIDRLATRGGRRERGGVAFVVCSNTPLVRGSDAGTRTWSLREGLQYVLHVPSRRLEQRFVLPAGAVVQQGVERVVMVQDGDSFRAQPVHVEFEDEDVAVVAHDGALFPGDPVVMTGAFALGLGMQGDAGVDPHAGHDHD